MHDLYTCIFVQAASIIPSLSILCNKAALAARTAHFYGDFITHEHTCYPTQICCKLLDSLFGRITAYDIRKMRMLKIDFYIRNVDISSRNKILNGCFRN